MDRFTRDEVSAKVWWPLALLGLIALVLSVPAGNRAADDARANAAARAATLSIATIQPLTTSGASAGELSAAARSIVAQDPSLSTVRVWSHDRKLLASSDTSDTLNSGAAMNDSDIEYALSTGPVWLVSDRTLTGEPGATTFNAYSAIDGPSGGVVTQFTALDATVLTDVHNFWLVFRIAVGLGTLLVFGLALLAMREPRARIGTGVPFYPENVPPWLRVIDVDRAVALEHAGERAKDRLTGLQTKLDESERLRLKAEGELQQALTALGTGGRSRTVVVPEAAAAATASRPSPEAATAAVAAAEEKKRARAAAAAEKQRAKAEAAETRRTRAKAKADADAAAEAARAQAIPPAPPEPVTASPTPSDEAWPEVVVVPEAQPAEMVTAGAARGGPDSDTEVLDVLERLVPERAEQPIDDTSELRSRLARTAALKKPGSRERQERRGEHEA